MNITKGEVKQMIEIESSKVNGNGVRFEIFVGDDKYYLQVFDTFDDARKYCRFMRHYCDRFKIVEIYIKVVLVELVGNGFKDNILSVIKYDE